MGSKRKKNNIPFAQADSSELMTVLKFIFFFSKILYSLEGISVINFFRKEEVSVNSVFT